MIPKCKLAIIKDFLSSHLKNNLFIIWRHGDRRSHARRSITFVSLLNSLSLCYVLIPVDVGGGDDRSLHPSVILRYKCRAKPLLTRAAGTLYFLLPEKNKNKHILILFSSLQLNCIQAKSIQLKS